MNILTIQTDWDFSIQYQDITYTDYSFNIRIENIKELENLRVGGPWGSPPFLSVEQCKVYELKDGIERIIKEPGVSFDQIGGNRGVAWVVMNPCTGIPMKRFILFHFEQYYGEGPCEHSAQNNIQINLEYEKQLIKFLNDNPKTSYEILDTHTGEWLYRKNENEFVRTPVKFNLYG